jgi:hypothetical protein
MYECKGHYVHMVQRKNYTPASSCLFTFKKILKYNSSILNLWTGFNLGMKVGTKVECFLFCVPRTTTLTFTYNEIYNNIIRN